MNNRFVKFGLVGGVGFIVDVTAMALFSAFMPVIPARGCAFWVAASSTWWCNRQFTFREADRCSPIKQWGKFLFSACVGFLPNWGCYWLLMKWVREEWIIQLAGSDATYFWPYAAMIPGVLLGMIVNFTLSACWVFQPATE